MRISDWSSDVCSSDLVVGDLLRAPFQTLHRTHGEDPHHLLAITGVVRRLGDQQRRRFDGVQGRSEEHTSELQSLMRISYAVFCLKKKSGITSLQYNSQLHE